MEDVSCYQCGETKSQYFLTGEDDLTGKPGRFDFVECEDCKLVYQNPRLPSENISSYYDDEYIAHRKKTNWGLLTPLYDRAMEKHDCDKFKIVSRHKKLDKQSRVLDIGCAVGSFLDYAQKRTGCDAEGVDFKDLSPWVVSEDVDFHWGRFDEVPLKPSFDLITMWHFLEHDYDPPGTLSRCRQLLADDGHLVIEVPRLDSRTYRWFGDRWPGVQAPQHTVLFTKDSFTRMIEDHGYEVIEYLPWGAFPAYFYVYAGWRFGRLKGSGLDLNKEMLPYFVAGFLSKPFFWFEKYLNLAMQTIICRKRPSH